MAFVYFSSSLFIMTFSLIVFFFLTVVVGQHTNTSYGASCNGFALLMYILLWALGPLGPITLLVQHTYTCTALYLYRTLMPPI